jgi:hypothetical protein
MWSSGASRGGWEGGGGGDTWLDAVAAGSWHRHVAGGGGWEGSDAGGGAQLDAAARLGRQGQGQGHGQERDKRERKRRSPCEGGR